MTTTPPAPLIEAPLVQLHGPGLERVLQGLLEISNFVGSVMLLDDILDRIVRISSELMGVPICSIYLLDDETKRLVLRSNVGFEREMIGQAAFEWGQGVPGWVAEHNIAVALRDATVDPIHKPMGSSIELGCRAYLCVPLRIQDEVIGAMTARRFDVHDFTRDEILFFETVGKQVAIVIEKARMYEEKIQVERLAAVAISLSGVAHYIKNVLLTMQGGEYLVEQGLNQGQIERAQEGWDVLRRANRKIRGLVENILNYCRKEELTPKPVPINAMVRELIESLARTSAERGVEVTADLDERLGEIELDPESFYDALLNLVTNAMDAIPEGRKGRVRVVTRRLEGRHQALIEVADNGSGIPEEIRSKIFSLFFSTKGKQGTGIGLAATRKIIEEHGGTIEFESEDGQGTRFKIYMPTSNISAQ